MNRFLLGRILGVVALGSSILMGACDAHVKALQHGPSSATAATTGSHAHKSEPAPASAVRAPSPAAQHYIDPRSINVDQLLPPPPAEQSAFAMAEAELIRAVQADTSAYAHRRAAHVEGEDTVWEFATVLGPNFNPAQCPRIARLFDVAEADANAVKNIAKNRYKRQRPPTSEIQASNPPATSDFSYPSGHCTRAFLRARLLAAISPQDAEQLLAEARAMCLNRLIAGRHYPTDAAGGIAVGDAVARAMLAGPAIKDDLNAAVQEWQAQRAAKLP